MKENPNNDNVISEQEGMAKLAYHVTLYVDLLGQQRLLRQLQSLPISDEDRKVTLRTLQRTAGTVRFVRKAFTRFLDNIQQPTEILNRIPEEARERALRMKEMKVRKMGFSDTFIIAAELSNDNEPWRPMNGIYAVLLSAAGMFGCALAEGIPLRGGIEIGLGISLSDDEVYGRGLVLAHDLECSLAEYPRIVVGPELERFIERVANSTKEDISVQYVRDLGQKCMNIIAHDTDGLTIVDFLGPEMKMIEENWRSKIVEPGYRFVTEQQKAAAERGDLKLFARYSRLRHYYEVRITDWGVVRRE